MDPAAEALIISKIRDGIFIGDFKAGVNQDLLELFKISHLINVSGKLLPYSVNELGIKYLSLNWPENPNSSDKKNNIILDSEITEIITFIDDSYINGEGLFGFSLNGKSRICVVVILYMMKKYKWPLKKCYDYVSTKKKDIDINNYYKEQLKKIEIKIFGEDNVIDDEKLFWIGEEITDQNELIMKNTYMNEVQDYELRKNNFFEEKSRYRIIRHVEWGDNKKFAKQMVQPGLVHYNIDKLIIAHYARICTNFLKFFVAFYKYFYQGESVMSSYSFYAMLSRMKYINRWGLMNNTRQENISEHSQQVAILAHALVLIHNKRFGGSLDVAPRYVEMDSGHLVRPRVVADVLADVVQVVLCVVLVDDWFGYEVVVVVGEDETVEDVFRAVLQPHGYHVGMPFVEQALVLPEHAAGRHGDDDVASVLVENAR